MSRSNLLITQAGLSVLLLITATWLSYTFAHVLGITGISMLFLLALVWIAYAFERMIALVAACVAFATINYFFIVPKYTFQIGSVESWASLVSFLVVAVVVASLVKQLKTQTALSMHATKQAEFARQLSERLSEIHDNSALTAAACEMLADQYRLDFKVLDKDNPSQFTGLAAHALEWVTSTGQSMGPHTHNWPEYPCWLIPLSRLPSSLPVMCVSANEATTLKLAESRFTLQAIQGHVEQVSQAYQRIQSEQRAKLAELAVQQETMQNALLASISHDMRTPLTSILGASTAIQQLPYAQANDEVAHLSSMIVSQARHLTATTENILSLIRLEALPAQDFHLDWQSPEEIVAMVTAHYQLRGDNVNIQTRADVADVLIRANPHLLLQALVNLIDNAMQVSAATVPIVLEVSATEEEVRFVVEDTGPGFAVDFDVTQIKKFSTTRKHGLGLGLPIVQQIAKLHEADLVIENKVANKQQTGARVTLCFKRAHMHV